MPAELFVDTSAWFAMACSAPEARAAERVLRDRIRSRVRIVTSNLVVGETYALLLHRAARDAALTFLREVSRPPSVIVWSTPETEERAVRDWLERYDDQNFSLTDAVSFAIMAERGIREALTLDHHFAAAGFTMLPGA